MDDAIAYGRQHGKDKAEQVDAALDALLVQFGKEILKKVPGRVSTEVDARFSFDKDASVKKALHIIDVRIHLPHSRTSEQCADSLAAIQRTGDRQVSRPHQARLHLGRHRRGPRTPV